MKKFFFVPVLLCLSLPALAFDYPDGLCQWKATRIKNIEVFRFIPRTTCERAVFPFSVKYQEDVWEALYFDGSFQIYNTALGAIVAYDGSWEGKLEITDKDVMVAPKFKKEIERIIRSIFPKRRLSANW